MLYVVMGHASLDVETYYDWVAGIFESEEEASSFVSDCMAWWVENEDALGDDVARARAPICPDRFVYDKTWCIDFEWTLQALEPGRSPAVTCHVTGCENTAIGMNAVGKLTCGCETSKLQAKNALYAARMTAWCEARGDVSRYDWYEEFSKVENDIDWSTFLDGKFDVDLEAPLIPLK